MDNIDAVNFVIRWVVVWMGLFVATYILGRGMTVEGMPGHLFIMFIVVPVNVIAGFTFGSVATDIPGPVAFFGLVFVLNLVLLGAGSKLLPGIEASGWLALILFVLVFSALTALVYAYFPDSVMDLLMPLEEDV